MEAFISKQLNEEKVIMDTKDLVFPSIFKKNNLLQI